MAQLRWCFLLFSACLSPGAIWGTAVASAAPRVDLCLPGVLLFMSESLEIYCWTEEHYSVEKKIKPPNIFFLAWSL